MIIYAQLQAVRCTTRVEIWRQHIKGMKISENDWSIFLQHAGTTLEALQVPKQECDEVVAFVLTLEKDIVEP